MRCRLVCKRDFQTIQVPDDSCTVQRIPGKMVSLEVEGRSSPVKRRAILKIIGTSLHYWHAPLPLDPTGPPTLDKGQLASPHLALAAKAFYENFSQPPNKYGNSESIIMRALRRMSTDPVKHAFPLHSIIFPCAIVRVFIFSHGMVLHFFQMRGEYHFQLQGWHDRCGPDPWEAQIFLNIQTNVDGSPLTLPSEASTLGHLFSYVQILINSFSQHYKEFEQHLEDGLLRDLFESLASIDEEPDLSTGSCE